MIIVRAVDLYRASKMMHNLECTNGALNQLQMLEPVLEGKDFLSIKIPF